MRASAPTRTSPTLPTLELEIVDDAVPGVLPPPDVLAADFAHAASSKAAATAISTRTPVCVLLLVPIALPLSRE